MMMKFQGGYPFLRIARDFGLPYREVLAVAEWYRDGRPLNPPKRYSAPIESFNEWLKERRGKPVISELAERVARALVQHAAMQKGLIDMEGNRIVRERKNG